MKKKRNPRINFEVTKDEKARIKKLAKKHHRTVSNLLRYLVLFEARKGEKWTISALNAESCYLQAQVCATSTITCSAWSVLYRLRFIRLSLRRTKKKRLKMNKWIKLLVSLAAVLGMMVGLWGCMITSGCLQINGLAIIITGGFILLWSKD